MQSQNVDFLTACQILSVQPPERQQKPAKRPLYAPPPAPASELRQDYACFDPAWQDKASAFAYHCGGELWDNWNTAPAARWLEARGINETTAIAACLGVNIATHWETWGAVDVWLPRGITIPWQIKQQFWNVRIRRPNPDLSADGGDKYISVKGCANGLYCAGYLRLGARIVMTEGEFDALIVNRFYRERQIDGIRAVSIGSCTGARVTRWIALLGLCAQIYLAFDNDGAGDQAAQYWQAALHPKAKRLRPAKKDITEDWQAGLLAGLLEGVQ